MPIYKYTCGQCGMSFEKLLSRCGLAISCPGCGGTELERNHSAFACGSTAARERPCERVGFSPSQCNPSACGCTH